MMNKYLSVSPEIEKALAEGKPVVALESTILSHGMPYPENVEFSHKVEEIVRAEGAIPATTAIIGGKLKVGLTAEELEIMCRADGVGKVSRRDVAVYLATGKTGATNTGRNLASTATKDAYSYTLVTMNAQRYYDNGDEISDNMSFVDAKQLYEWAFDNWAVRSVVKTSTIVSEVKVELAKDTDVIPVFPDQDDLQFSIAHSDSIIVRCFLIYSRVI